ncbi:MAG: alpha/beta fold hydrolase [Promethearchaeota archaeon]|nr:MAG: alpha/beta fold hydrolase [Candidatus Lokiarchaeota archaeon]
MESTGRYQNIVNELILEGYIIFGNDFLGHDKSEGIRNYIDSFGQFIEDEKIFYDLLKEKHPNLPLFILGHSLGSFIAIYFTKKYESLLARLIFSRTWTSYVIETSGFLKFFAIFFSKITPKMKFNPRINAKFLSQDLEVVKSYENDPLVNAN